MPVCKCYDRFVMGGTVGEGGPHKVYTIFPDSIYSLFSYILRGTYIIKLFQMYIEGAYRAFAKGYSTPVMRNV